MESLTLDEPGTQDHWTALNGRNGCRCALTTTYVGYWHDQCDKSTTASCSSQPPRVPQVH